MLNIRTWVLAARLGLMPCRLAIIIGLGMHVQEEHQREEGKGEVGVA